MSSAEEDMAEIQQLLDDIEHSCVIVVPFEIFTDTRALLQVRRSGPTKSPA